MPVATTGLAPTSIADERVRTALFDLAISRQALSALEPLLDAQERARAVRYRDARDRDRFIARRGQLRTWLAKETGEAPGAIRICIGAHGKPFLPHHRDLRFNLSSSSDLALAIIGRGVEVGCDIERRDPNLACRRVADHLFAPAEITALDALPPALWTEGFFNCWTRKEAYVKALGLGLSCPLHAFSVSVAPGEPAQLIEARPGWSLTAFEPAPGYQAALVTGTF